MTLHPPLIVPTFFPIFTQYPCSRSLSKIHSCDTAGSMNPYHLAVISLPVGNICVWRRNREFCWWSRCKALRRGRRKALRRLVGLTDAEFGSTPCDASPRNEWTSAGQRREGWVKMRKRRAKVERVGIILSSFPTSDPSSRLIHMTDIQ